MGLFYWYTFNKYLSPFFFRSKAASDQFTDGLNDVGGLWRIVVEESSLFSPLFVYSAENNHLTVMDIKSLCKVNYTEDNQHTKHEEEDTVYAWEHFLRECDG